MGAIHFSLFSVLLLEGLLSMLWLISLRIGRRRLRRKNGLGRTSGAVTMRVMIGGEEEIAAITGGTGVGVIQMIDMTDEIWCDEC
jgi:hypothetical protein